MTTTRTIVEGHAFARVLAEPHRARLVALGVPVEREAGAFLLREGEPAETLYLLHRGTVSIELADPGRGARRVGTVEAGDVVGLSWLFPPYRWQYDARAVDRVEALAIPTARLRAEMDADPAFGYAIAGVLLQRAHERLQLSRLHCLDLYREDR